MVVYFSITIYNIIVFDTQNVLLTIKVWIIGNKCLPLQQQFPPRLLTMRTTAGLRHFYSYEIQQTAHRHTRPVGFTEAAWDDCQ